MCFNRDGGDRSSPQLPDLAQAYYQRALGRAIHALAELSAKLADRGLLRIAEPLLVASHVAFPVVGQVLDESLFCGVHPFSERDLHAQATAGVRAFVLTAMRTKRRLRLIPTVRSHAGTES